MGLGQLHIGLSGQVIPRFLVKRFIDPDVSSFLVLDLEKKRHLIEYLEVFCLHFYHLHIFTVLFPRLIRYYHVSSVNNKEGYLSQNVDWKRYKADRIRERF